MFDGAAAFAIYKQTRSDAAILYLYLLTTSCDTNLIVDLFITLFYYSKIVDYLIYSIYYGMLCLAIAPTKLRVLKHN